MLVESRTFQMDTITGIPTHPLVVHLPVVLIPLATIGVLLMAARQGLYQRYRWEVLAVGFVGMLGSILAASSGEELEHQIGEAEGREAVRAIQEHADAGELARTASIVFFVILAGWVLLPWFGRRLQARAAADDAGARTMPTWLNPALTVLVVIAALAATGSVIVAGHSGAAQVWESLAG